MDVHVIQLQAEKMRNLQLGGHDMVRRVDPNGEALVWCRKCPEYARCRCRPEDKDAT